MEYNVIDKTEPVFQKTYGGPNSETIHIEVQGLSYSFTEHRARYKIFFSVSSPWNYGDGMLSLYDDTGEIVPSPFIDDSITAEELRQVSSLINEDFVSKYLPKHPVDYYVLPDFS